jgi:hypothetical protein
MGPLGGVPPQLAAAIAAWQAAQQAQQSALPPVTPPMTSPPMMPTQQNVPSGFMGLLYRAAQEKFKRGMATPLADKAGWSAGWGDRPLGMQQSPALPNQAQFSGLGDLGGGGGGYTNPVAKPPVY